MSAKITVDETTKKRQALASAPAVSAWVAANAGSGKTFVLARRVIRLLLEGGNPSKILCLTFTKAAAAEMSERVFNALALWTTCDEQQLRDDIFDLSGGPVSDSTLMRARQLFALALETPGGLKIQTIHAFCERLLHQFPVEANVAGHFEMLDDKGATFLRDEARRDIFLEIEKIPGSRLSKALEETLFQRSDKVFNEALQEILTMQDAFSDWIAIQGSLEAAFKNAKQNFGLTEDETTQSLSEAFFVLPDLPKAYLESLIFELSNSSKSFVKAGESLQNYLENHDKETKKHALFDYFFTKEGKPKSLKSLASKEIYSLFPGLDEHLLKTQDYIVSLIDKIRALETLQKSKALFVIGEAIAKRFSKLKSERGLMDFDDLINKAANLLKSPEGAAWVHYKLDQGLDHILVDEAQDTSPKQWQVISSLAEEFFVGSSARLQNRTIFAVGDEKQSIYSFHGAAPKLFSTMQKHFHEKAEKAEKPFHKIPLSLSFRSTTDILGAVDIVFGKKPISDHLTQDYVDHTAARLNQKGFVEIWPPFKKPNTPEHKGEWWQPLDSEGSEVLAMASKIADKIKQMIESGERLEGTGKIIQAGDILILARKRGIKVDAVNRTLKEAGIDVAGSDRLNLLDNIAVLDLLALADFVLLSEDDLALAGLLKSPLVGLNENDLFTLAHKRKGTLWSALYSRAKKGEAPFKEIHEKLDQWRREADFTPPYDFYLNVLARDQGRAAYLSHLGVESDEILEAFLTEVQNFEQRNIPSLQGFTNWFRSGSVNIKRDMEAVTNAVRVMTVHGAKGLEAPIVFLLDGGAPFHASHQPEILSLSEEKTGPFIWKQPKGKNTKTQDESLKVYGEAITSEYYRLLYVAMTRAKDRLYIVATGDNKGAVAKQSWYDLISQTLLQDQHCLPITNEEGEIEKWHWQISPNISLPNVSTSTLTGDDGILPDFFKKSAPQPEKSPAFLTPSKTVDEDGENTFQMAIQAGIPAPLRGILIHKMLEKLPNIAPETREELAFNYLKGENLNTDENELQSIIDEALKIINNPHFAFLFKKDKSVSEVPIAAHLTINDKSYQVRGIVDRLVDEDDFIHIIDFKTNQNPPENETGLSLTYQRQLAIYREVLKPIYPEKQLKTSILWTRTETLMPLSDELMKSALTNL